MAGGQQPTVKGPESQACQERRRTTRLAVLLRGVSLSAGFPWRERHLAAGAGLFAPSRSPVLLLRSACGRVPSGLANFPSRSRLTSVHLTFALERIAFFQVPDCPRSPAFPKTETVL